MSSAVLCIAFNQSIGQSFSALCASSLEYVSAVSSSHSLSETVLFFSLSLLRLVSSEHLMHLLNLVVFGHEHPKSYGSVLLVHIAKYSMTSYIKPYFFSFVKSFFN